jgi:hypothetical protein
MVPFVPEPSPCAQELRLASRSVPAEAVDRKSSARLDFVLDIQLGQRVSVSFVRSKLHRRANLKAGFLF